MLRIGGIAYKSEEVSAIIDAFTTKGQLHTILEPNQRLILLTCANMCGKTESEMLQAFSQACAQIATEEEAKIVTKSA